jgi:NAD-dependent SIR2 family protein deacetylase
MLQYLEFANLLKDLNQQAQGGYRCSVITFNYDLVMDYAMFSANTGFDYSLEGVAPRYTPLLKLHGSLNWGACSECKSITPWYLGKYFQAHRFYETNEIHLPLGTQLGRSELQHCERPINAAPVIVPPTWNKMDYNESLGHVWRRAAQELSNAENIFVIGYSLPETDSFFRYLYALGSMGERLIKRFWVFDPDPTGEVQIRFARLLGKAVESRFEFKKIGFPQCLANVRQEFQERLAQT